MFIRLLFYLLCGLFQCLGCVAVGIAQEPSTDFEITHFKLPVETTTSDILEDKYGFVWIASTNGLWRYDGGNFKNYIKDENEETSITDNHISCLYEDKSGELWVGTYGGGLLKYDREYDRFQRFIHDDGDPTSLSFNEVRVIFETSNNNFYIGTDGGGLNKMDRSTGIFETFEHVVADPLSISHNNVLAIEEGKDGKLFVGTWIGLNIFDSKTGKFKRLSQASTGAAHYYPNLEYYDDLLVSNTKLYSLDESNQFHDIRFEFERASHIKTDYEGNCWLVEKDRIAIINSDLNIEHLIALGPKFNDDEFNLNRIFHNKKTNDSWVLDQTGNFFQIKESPIIFKHFLEPEHDSKIFKTDLNYWVFAQGIIKIYSKTDKELLATLSGFEGRTHMTSYHRQYVWVVDDNHIYQFSASGKQLQKLVRKNGQTFDVLETSDGQIWTGEVLGARIYNPDTKETTYFDCDPNAPRGIGYFHRGNIIFEDVKKQIWIGTDGDGLKKYLPDTQEFVHYRHEIGNTETVNNNFINTIFEDSDHTLWVGTNSGLCSYNEKTNTFKQYGHNVLRDKIIKAIQQDDDGNLWIGTSNGLIKFDLSNEEVRILNEQDGLLSHKIGLSSTVLDYGHLVFSTTKGLMAFDPRSVEPNMKAPTVYISKLWVDNEIVQPNSTYIQRSIEVEDQLNLEYTDRKIELEFQAIQYVNTQRCQYAYKLEGFDTSWAIANGTKATYTNLPSGEYSFLLKASNEDGVWNEAITRLKVVVRPPFWELLWVQLLLACILIVLLWVIVRGVIRRERIKSKFELEKQRVYQFEELAQMKLRFFTNISHELRTPLTLITSPLDKFSRQGARPDAKVLRMMHRNSNRLLELVNQILDFRKLENNQKLKLKQQNDLSVCANIHAAYSYWSKEKGIKFRCSLPTVDYGGYFDADILEKIVANLISNAFKFTPANGRIELKASYSNIVIDAQNKISSGALTIEVIDNGTGIPKKYQEKVFERFYQLDETPNKGYSSGIGLSLISELVKLHRGNIKLESEEEKGSHFTISMPIGYDDYGASVALVPTIPNIEKGSAVVLIIEDNEDIRSYLCSELEEDYHVLQAENGKEGFNMALESIPDIVISDIMMPKSDGIQVANQLKTNELTAHIPLIFLTAKTGLENRLKGLETGAEDYIQKPFNSSEIKLKIQNRLESRRRLVERSQKEVLVSESTTPMDKYLVKVNGVIDQQMNNADFSIDLLCEELAIGRSQLYRKIQALTGKTIIEYINTHKLAMAMRLLKEGELSIKEIAFEVGYNDNRYFSRIFKKEYGHPPSFYQSKRQK
ncbi:two-component regulator propeller domain-containing protein [uncultured Kriegella sp.]|uniref:hybrid sensor histidine kinase/response regulator transcription factor n=1 Tax=uncultured Kriegella sp. TaxID=1798910 RepID=UPI0030DAC362|tara:strand:- start:253 stop:4170 length:3918 start_codon:yes stop_codon:yes gene_type:complete